MRSITEETKAWNMKYSGESEVISAEPEDMWRFGRIPPDSVAWNNRVHYKERGPETGIRLWKTDLAINGIQFKHGEQWAEEKKMTQIRKRYFCFTSGFELCLDEVEFVLDPGEFITALETRSNQITGCQLILRIQTSNNKTFISHADDIDGRILRFHWEIDQCLSNPEIAEKGQNSEPVDDSDEPNVEIVESCGTTNEEMQHLCCTLNINKQEPA